MAPKPNVAGASTNPQDRFRLTKRTPETTQENRIHQRMNYKIRITTTYIIVCSLMRTIKPQNVVYRRTNPGHNHTKYIIMQWHDRRRPHASQWPKLAYQCISLTSLDLGCTKWALHRAKRDTFGDIAIWHISIDTL